MLVGREAAVMVVGRAEVVFVDDATDVAAATGPATEHRARHRVDRGRRGAE